MPKRKLLDEQTNKQNKFINTKDILQVFHAYQDKIMSTTNSIHYKRAFSIIFLEMYALSK